LIRPICASSRGSATARFAFAASPAQIGSSEKVPVRSAPIEANLAFSTAFAATPSRRTPRPRSAVRLLPRPSSAIRVAWLRRATTWLAPCRRASLPCSRLAALDASLSRPTCSASSSVASRRVSLVPHCALPCVVLPGPKPASRHRVKPLRSLRERSCCSRLPSHSHSPSLARSRFI